MQKTNFVKNASRALRFNSSTLKQYRNFITAYKSSPYINPRIHIKTQVCFNYIRFLETGSSKCWNCGTSKKSIADILCDKCNVIQEPYTSDNYFKVLNVQENYDVDLKLLTTKYRKLQAVLHPDKFSNKSEREKNISTDYSALVNRAYNTLQTPLNRAIHMLNLHGEKVEEDQKVTDPEFLMEIMELNEEVEAANAPDELKKLNEKNKYALKEIEKEISKYFKENQIKKAKESIIKMKYYNSVSLHINGLLRERGIVD